MKSVLTVVAGVLAALSLAAAAMAGTTSRHPRLELIRRAPLEVRGTGFRPKETVTVRWSTYRVHVRSSSAGGFVAGFPAGDPCSGGGRVVAAGVRGDHATLRLPPAMCPMA